MWGKNSHSPLGGCRPGPSRPLVGGRPGPSRPLGGGRPGPWRPLGGGRPGTLRPLGGCRPGPLRPLGGCRPGLSHPLGGGRPGQPLWKLVCQLLMKHVHIHSHTTTLRPGTQHRGTQVPSLAPYKKVCSKSAMTHTWKEPEYPSSTGQWVTTLRNTPGQQSPT